MDKHSMKELSEVYKKRYKKGNAEEKTKMLDEYIALSGMHRKSAIRKFNSSARMKKRKPRISKYTFRVKRLIWKAWDLSSGICAERLHPQIGVYIRILEANDALGNIDSEEREIAEKVSLGSLKDIVDAFPKSGIHSTKHHKRNADILKQIPIKADFGKYDMAGKVEVDFVEHCGTQAVGRFVNSTTLCDVFTGWTTNGCSMGKDRVALNTAFQIARARIYHSISEFHPDNNAALLVNLLDLSAEKTAFLLSRSRPYKKNDNAHVEQKNGDRVRKWVGYHRYDTQDELSILNELYAALDLYSNFFLPSFKLQEVLRDHKGKFIKKVYDKPKTPYARLLESDISTDKKLVLTDKYLTLNMYELKKKVDKLLEKLNTVYTKKSG